MRQEIVLASANPGKLRELRALLAPLGIRLLSQGELAISSVPENGLSFEENALLKARHAARHAGLPAIADDSGLEVDALDGAPGIYSARYAGPGATDADNNRLLLRKLEGVPEARRNARFRCCIAYLRRADDPAPLICQGAWEGCIVSSAGARVAGGAGGFGYDPLFYLPQLGCTSADLSPARKNRLSHRGQAVRKLAQSLAAGRPAKPRRSGHG